ncbi:MAG: BlaI/MecI/CopY family transcriptional regulator [Phycisphaerae bacterium]|nr:BlaI/MecI/CopY family transcriptional regulator [Phycisphaerae bacterium]
MKTAKPSDLQRQILSVLWEKGPSTVREVLKIMPDGKERAYTTILSVMQVMEKKGFLSRSKRGTAHVYKPTDTQEQIVTPYLKGVVANIFGGKPAVLVEALLKLDISKEEIKEISELLATAGKKK